jgi:hypothetical protein
MYAEEKGTMVQKILEAEVHGYRIPRRKQKTDVVKQDLKDTQD